MVSRINGDYIPAVCDPSTSAPQRITLRYYDAKQKGWRRARWGGLIIPKVAAHSNAGRGPRVGREDSAPLFGAVGLAKGKTTMLAGA